MATKSAYRWRHHQQVTRLSEGFLHIEIANNVEVQIQRSAVACAAQGYGEVKSLKSGRGGGGRRQPSSVEPLCCPPR